MKLSTYEVVLLRALLVDCIILPYNYYSTTIIREGKEVVTINLLTDQQLRQHADDLMKRLLVELGNA